MGRIQGEAPLAGLQRQKAWYSIDWKSDLDSYFEIDPVEGTIATKELLDRENMAQHNVSIVATKVNNPVLSSKVAVIVHVLDVNEFPPELSIPYETFVCENSKTNQVSTIFSMFCFISIFKNM
ncbi:Cadherin-12 [Acipenser ruthenus]|uniref:Cadherin-12 n=1 Tax=Acipenser ruthenus TaxID=7906 RepID=A0A662YRX2_ACIRT|nr:Cadherin-12 [Acipenser ruthenus]